MTTIIHPIAPTEHGSGVKKVLAVVAAVAIPWAAPKIAAAIGASQVLGATISTALTTTAGQAVGGAIVGAGLGAVTAKVTGQDVRAGALMGAIGGGIGGYTQAVSSAPVTAGASQGAPATASGAGAGGAGLTPISQTSSGLPSANIGTAGNVGNTTSNFTNSLTQASLNTAPTAASQLSNAPAAASGLSGYTQQFITNFKKVPSKILSSISDPDNLAQLTLQAGGQLLGAALYPTPEMDPEAQAALDQVTQDLALLRERDEAKFNALMDQSKAHVQRASSLDPNYFANQTANNALIQASRKLREMEEQASTTGGLSAGEKRRYGLDVGRQYASAHDRGWMQGHQLQGRELGLARSALPTPSATAVNAGINTYNIYSAKHANEVADARRNRAGLSYFFGKLQTTTGRDKEDEDRVKRLIAEENKKYKSITDKGSSSDNNQGESFNPPTQEGWKKKWEDREKEEHGGIYA